MKTKRKCPNCTMTASQQIAEGISHHKWYSYYECEHCKSVQSMPSNRPATVDTEYSYSSTPSTPIGINSMRWPNDD